MTLLNRYRYAIGVCGGVLLVLTLLAPVSVLRAAPSAWRDPATGFAIGGYDPVAYFTRNSPVLGRIGLEHRWGGAIWQFDNRGNRDVFAKHPGVYAPGFAGYDALALSRGLTVQGAPRIWAMYKQRIYFFYDIASRNRWRRDRQKITAAAKANWTRLARELPGTSER